MAKEASPAVSAAVKKIGRALSGMAQTKDTYRLIGEFFHHFSQVEFTMRFLLSRLMNIDADIFDAVTAPYDLVALCSVTVCSGQKTSAYRKGRQAGSRHQESEKAE